MCCVSSSRTGTGQGTQSTDTGRYNRANQSMVGNNWELRKEYFEHIIITMLLITTKDQNKNIQCMNI